MAIAETELDVLRLGAHADENLARLQDAQCRTPVRTALRVRSYRVAASPRQTPAIGGSGGPEAVEGQTGRRIFGLAVGGRRARLDTFSGRFLYPTGLAPRRARPAWRSSSVG